MKLPYAQPKRNKIKPTIEGFRGLNRNTVTAPNQITAALNMSTKDLPCLVTRPSREVYSTLTDTPNALFTSQKLCWVDGTNFTWDGTIKGTVANGAKSLVDFNGCVVIFPDKKYYDYVEDRWGDVGNGSVYPAAGSCPDIDVACVHNNRIFGIKGSNIYACALGNMQDWTTFVNENGEPSEVGAYAADVASAGDFIGCAEFQNHVVMFKPDMIHELYGQMPGNFSVLQVSKSGAISSSLVEIDSMLYFISEEGVFRYSGGQPAVLSRDLNEIITSGNIGSDGRMCYVSAVTHTGNKMYVFDTDTGDWMQEDDLQVVQFARYGGHLYALAADKRIYKFNSGNEKFDWHIETAEFTENHLGKKVNTGVSFRVELDPESVMDVSVSADGTEYSVVKSLGTGSIRQMHTVFIPPVQCERFKIKLSGHGRVRIYGMSREVSIGGDWL